MDARGYFLTDGTGSPDGRFFFTANSKSDSVSMFDTVRGRLLRVIDLNAPAQNRLLRANVVNAASLLPGPVAPGEVITIFGAGLGPEEEVSDGAGLAGVRVLFDGSEAPLLYVQSNRIFAPVPEGVSTGGSVGLAIDYQGAVTKEAGIGNSRRRPSRFFCRRHRHWPCFCPRQAPGNWSNAADPAARGRFRPLLASLGPCLAPDHYNFGSQPQRQVHHDGAPTFDRGPAW